MTLAWQQPLWGALTQVGVGGGAPAGPAASTFMFLTRLESPITSGYEPICGLGTQAPTGGFIAPFDMRLKAWSDRVTRSGGYRQDTEFAYRVNGGAVVELATILTGTEDHRIHETDILFSEGDEVELLYSCGNNYNMGVGLAFYFEKDGASSAGPMLLMQQDQSSLATSYGSFHWGGNSANYNVMPVVPRTIVVRDVMYAVATATTGDNDVQLGVDGAYTDLGTMLAGGTDVAFTDLGQVVLRGQYFGVQAKSSFSGDSLPSAIMVCEAPGASDAGNISFIAFSDNDAASAQGINRGAMRMPASGTITQIDVACEYAHSNDINVSVNGGASSSIMTYTAVSNGDIESSTPNYAFSGGDVLDFDHDGTGLGGFTVTIWFEFDNVDDYETPTYTPPVADQPAGDSQWHEPEQNAESSSTFNMKGNFILAAEDRMMTGVRGRSGAAGYTCRYKVWEVDYNYEMVSLLWDSGEWTSIDGWEEYALDTPVLLEAGKMYCVAAVRTDAAQLRWYADSDPIAKDDAGLFWMAGVTLQTDYSPLVGDDMYYASRDAWAVMPITEKPAMREKFKFWSILCEGSADATSQGLAAVVMRELWGGDDITADFSAMQTSAEDSSFPAANVEDGLASTRWKFDDADYDAADRRLVLGATTGKDIVEIDITATDDGNHDETPTDFKVQYSYDGIGWLTAKTVTGEAAWSSGETRTYEVVTAPNDDSEDDHEYWAIMCYDSDNTAYLGIMQIEMMETPGGSDITTTGFAIAGDERVGWEATKAFDDDFTTASKAWSVQYSATRYIDRWCGQNFGSGNGKNIQEVTISARNDSNEEQAPRLFAVVYSDDGLTWRPAWIVKDDTNWSAAEKRTYTKP